MNWIRVFGSEAEARVRVENDKPQLLILSGIRIALVLHRGIFFAVQDSCTHNGASLCDGRINYLGEIVCPWHGYRFDLMSGRAADSSCRDLKTYPVRADESGFYIGLT